MVASNGCRHKCSGRALTLAAYAAICEGSGALRGHRRGGVGIRLLALNCFVVAEGQSHRQVEQANGNRAAGQATELSVFGAIIYRAAYQRACPMAERVRLPG